MADEVDKANDSAEIVLGALIQTQSKPIKPFFNESQTCLNCGETVPTTAHKFCCPECEEDFRARQEAERRNHGNG